MIIAPLSWNLLPSGTVLTSALRFQAGCPAANLWDADPRKACVWRGLMDVTASLSDRVDFNDGAARVASLTVAVYNSVAESCVQLAAAMNAVSSNWVACQLQGSTDRHRIQIRRTSGTASLQINTGANTARNALKNLFGFRDADRAAAASHTGDYAVIHGQKDVCLVDLGSAKTAQAIYYAGIDTGPAGSVFTTMGSTTATSDIASYPNGEWSDEISSSLLFTPATYRYVQLNVSNPRRESWNRVGLGYWYYGPAYDTDNRDGFDGHDITPSSYARALEVKTKPVVGLLGHPFGAEVAPGETVAVAFEGPSGMAPGGGPGIEALAAELGIGDLAFVTVNTGRIQPETILGRLTEMPTINQIGHGFRLSRLAVSLTFERVAIL